MKSYLWILSATALLTASCTKADEKAANDVTAQTLDQQFISA